jgi:hypothetical protein
VRAGEGASILAGRRVAMHLLVQPGVAATLLGDALLGDQGMLSRLLVSAPATAMGTRIWRDPPASAEHGLARYGARILELLERELPTAGQGELAPRQLPLSGRARQL